MKVSKKDIDKLNSILSIDIEKNDFESNVENVLKDYRKRANIPGFRKGHTPIGLIKKQYGLSSNFYLTIWLNFNNVIPTY